MPKFALLCVERLVQLGSYHVFDADEARAGVGAIVQYALPHIFGMLALSFPRRKRLELESDQHLSTFGQVAAVVISLDVTFWVVSVDVECVQMRTDGLDWREVLGRMSDIKHEDFPRLSKSPGSTLLPFREPCFSWCARHRRPLMTPWCRVDSSRSCVTVM